MKRPAITKSEVPGYASLIASYMAHQRWAKATPEQKAEQARKMVAGRRKAARKRAKKG